MAERNLSDPDFPSFHIRVPGEAPEGSEGGYPKPGEQSPDVETVMDDHFFVDDEGWKKVLTAEWDFIVVGSGLTALAFVEAALENEPKARVLVLERGPFWLTQHFQDTPLPFKFMLGGRSEMFPDSLPEDPRKRRALHARLLPVLRRPLDLLERLEPGPD